MASQLSPATNTLTEDYWQQRWTDGAIGGFHEQGGNKMLWNHMSKLLQEHFPTKNVKDLTAFVPLCGKSKDMYMFYEMGFTVVGVEFSPNAIEDFFKENGITNVNTNEKPFSKSSDGRLMIGQGDLFTFHDINKGPCEKYDIIWDRASFESVNENEREKYAKLMKSLKKDDGLYIINVFELDRSEYGGPPLSVTKEELERYFSAQGKVVLLESGDKLGEDRPDRQRWIDKGLTKMTENLYIIG